MQRKQLFKGKILFKTRLVNRIIKIYNDDTFDFNEDWYNGASILANDLSIKYNVDYLKVCGIIAALSPLKSWTENKKIAILFLRSGKANHTRLLTAKAQSILDNTEVKEVAEILRILNGNKIQNFFLNIAFPNGMHAVTIDRHALSICLARSIKDDESRGMTTIQYNFFAACYIEASEIIGIRPSQVQSVTWEKWRELKKVTPIINADMPF